MQKDNKIREAIKEAEKLNIEYNYYNYISEVNNQNMMPEKQGKLSGYTVSVKDAINVKNMKTTAGSAILDNYKPMFDATVIKRIRENGAIITGKANQDAFGFGSFNTNVGKNKKIPLNPFDKHRACGGSSGGCAGITQKTESNHVSLGESTGGSIVCPASFCGVVGLCPTYGRVSRYGLIDYGSSLDKIGPMGKNIKDTALLLEVISGYDKKDNTSSDKEIDEYTSYANKDIKGMKIGIIKEAFGDGVRKEIKDNVNQIIENLKNQGIDAEEVSLKLESEFSLPVYYILAMCEASTNLAMFCGMRYGKIEDPSGKGFNEYFTSIRSDNLNNESKRRILIGTFARMAGFRDAYYIKAAKIRTMIIQEYKNIFKKYDALICPTVPVIAPKFDEIKNMTPLENFMIDKLTVGPNLAGLPHITIPTGKVENMPIGTMLIADHFEEKKLIQIGSAIEKITQSKQ